MLFFPLRNRGPYVPVHAVALGASPRSRVYVHTPGRPISLPGVPANSASPFTVLPKVPNVLGTGSSLPCHPLYRCFLTLLLLQLLLLLALPSPDSRAIALPHQTWYQYRFRCSMLNPARKGNIV
ncbi:hypothetical protein CALCODRAFT_499295 [Calocera cornea HHB12733]|uniref:Uncharacterized protein n=1 Tax=Calocera cornea HHB12733 TaxID=1353952 RepID=A0A165EHE4_9BASI|nr:hypothetical protein CALCODRAFT_499295 [Calocera cornea HHB12733]